MPNLMLWTNGEDHVLAASAEDARRVAAEFWHDPRAYADAADWTALPAERIVSYLEEQRRGPDRERFGTAEDFAREDPTPRLVCSINLP